MMGYIYLILAMCSSASLSIMSTLFGRFNKSKNISGLYSLILTATAFVMWGIICLYEGEINMVIHANGGVIDVLIAPDKIVATLKDNGPGIPDIEKAMQEGFSTATNQVRELGFGAGMGLPNMKKYSDEMNITTKLNEGTTIEMIFYTK